VEGKKKSLKWWWQLLMTHTLKKLSEWQAVLDESVVFI
jgi:hypothetical protein